jgi:hypothetical protein
MKSLSLKQLRLAIATLNREHPYSTGRFTDEITELCAAERYLSVEDRTMLARPRDPRQILVEMKHKW